MHWTSSPRSQRLRPRSIAEPSKMVWCQSDSTWLDDFSGFWCFLGFRMEVLMGHLVLNSVHTHIYNYIYIN
jgi:hypothetical protein